MKHAAKSCSDDEGEDRYFREGVVAEKEEVRDLRESFHCHRHGSFFLETDSVFADLLFELKDETRADVLQDAWCASFFQFFCVGHKLVLLLVDEEDRTTTDSIRDSVIE